MTNIPEVRVVSGSFDGLKSLLQPMILIDQVKPDDSEQYTSRWTRGTNQKLQEAVRTQLAKGVDLPSGWFDKVHVEFSQGKRIELLDLRGINISHVRLSPKYDLAYLCLDFCHAEGTVFEQSLAQFSTFRCANLVSSSWNRVQASPICAQGACFSHSVNNGSFMMFSDFRKSEHLWTIYNSVIMDHSCLDGATRNLDSWWHRVSTESCVGLFRVVGDTEPSGKGNEHTRFYPQPK